MKRILFWSFIVSLIAFLIVWGMMGLKLLNGSYEIIAEAYISLALCIACFVSLAGYRFAASKCPHCGKTQWIKGKYCSCCGKMIADG